MVVIQVEHLVKQYKGSKYPSIDDISFTVNKGQFFALLGPNGAGKTTTISILTTTLSKTAGKIEIAGYDLDTQAKEVRKHVGIIFQKASLDPQLTAEENIRFHACLYGMYGYRPSFKLMPAEYRKQVLELAKIVGIEDSLFKPIKKLSGGMQRKLEIIRSLIHTPAVLFLDEPTQGLDAMSRRNLWEYLNRIRQQYGTTIFLTTHYIDEAENADTVCIINHGKIIACQSPEEMKQHLVKPTLILDSANRHTLLTELDALQLSYQVHNHVNVAIDTQSAQSILSKLKTPLSVLKIHEPTLEDAYIMYVNNNGGTLV